MIPDSKPVGLFHQVMGSARLVPASFKDPLVSPGDVVCSRIGDHLPRRRPLFVTDDNNFLDWRWRTTDAALVLAAMTADDGRFQWLLLLTGAGRLAWIYTSPDGLARLPGDIR